MSETQPFLASSKTELTVNVDYQGLVGRFFEVYTHLKRQKPSDLLSWSHHVELLRIEDPLESSFYEKQAIREKWSVPELQRQKKSSLFFPLAAGKYKDASRASTKGAVSQMASNYVTRLVQAACGAKVTDRLSSRNLVCMKFFAREFSDGPIAQQPVAQLPWGTANPRCEMKVEQALGEAASRDWRHMSGLSALYPQSHLEEFV
jgi:predicted nuclease of restriction endonuclease-like (RecB) superfamily